MVPITAQIQYFQPVSRMPASDQILRIALLATTILSILFLVATLPWAISLPLEATFLGCWAITCSPPLPWIERLDFSSIFSPISFLRWSPYIPLFSRRGGIDFSAKKWILIPPPQMQGPRALVGRR